MIKRAIRYQVTKFGEAIMVYYTGMVVILILAICLMKTMVEGGSIRGAEGITNIVIFALALSSFPNTLKMLLQNGISRKTVFYSYIITVTGTSFMMALISKTTNIILEMLFKKELAASSIAYIWNNSILQSLDGFSRTTISYMLAATLGSFISILYYRMNKKQRVLVFIGGPSLIPVISMSAPFNKVSRGLYNGIINLSANIIRFTSQNNYYLMAMAALFVLGALSYQLIKKAVVKTS